MGPDVGGGVGLWGVSAGPGGLGFGLSPPRGVGFAGVVNPSA